MSATVEQLLTAGRQFLACDRHFEATGEVDHDGRAAAQTLMDGAVGAITLADVQVLEAHGLTYRTGKGGFEVENDPEPLIACIHRFLIDVRLD